MSAPRILLTNDDGIGSAGLLAAAEALIRLGDVTVVAPGRQWSGAGRSVPPDNSGRVLRQRKIVGGVEREIYAVDGTPSQAVLIALLEILPEPPDLVVAGINAGENVGTSVTLSGTIGAVLEAAGAGIPALAVSYQIPIEQHLARRVDADYSSAAFFTGFFATRMLSGGLPGDVDALKVDVPSGATPSTPWKVTRISRSRYFIPVRPKRVDPEQTADIPYGIEFDPVREDPQSDVYALRVDRMVSVSPISLDLTSRIALSALDGILRR
jgi:5'-nucleotidase